MVDMIDGGVCMDWMGGDVGVNGVDGQMCWGGPDGWRH